MYEYTSYTEVYIVIYIVIYEYIYKIKNFICVYIFE